MTVLAAKLVDWSLLGQAVAASIVIGLAVLVVAGLAVVGSLKAQDESGTSHAGAALGFNALAVLCVLGIVAAVAGGIWAMTQ